MHQDLLSLTDNPVDIKLYTPHIMCTDTTILYGEKIRNAYDHTRINFKSGYETTRLRVNDTCLYGVSLTPNNKFNHIKNKITTVALQHENVVEMYKNRLKLYNLSCDTCWAYLEENIFPVDVEHLSEITINSPYMKPHDMFEQDESLPWFSQHIQPKLFIVTNT